MTTKECFKKKRPCFGFSISFSVLHVCAQTRSKHRQVIDQWITDVSDQQRPARAFTDDLIGTMQTKYKKA